MADNTVREDGVETWVCQRCADILAVTYKALAPKPVD